MIHDVTQEYFACRKPERALNKCMFEKLVCPRRLQRISCLLERIFMIGPRKDDSWLSYRPKTNTRGREPHIHYSPAVNPPSAFCLASHVVLYRVEYTTDVEMDTIQRGTLNHRSTLALVLEITAHLSLLVRYVRFEFVRIRPSNVFLFPSWCACTPIPLLGTTP